MLKKYGFLGLFKLCISLLYTKLFFKNARLIRLPIDIRYKKNISFGNKLTTGKNCRIETSFHKSKNKLLFFGDNVQLNDFVHITAHEYVSIGNNVLIASKVYISDVSHGSYIGSFQSTPNETPSSRTLVTKPVIIEDNVWLGEGVCILPGVTIGHGTIIGSNSVVTKDIPSNSIAVGSPARVIKVFNDKTNSWDII